jgi:uncharacterized membrane protein
MISKTFKSIFLKGLLLFLPFALSIYILFALLRGIEDVVESLITSFLPNFLYFPGLGTLIAVGFIFLMGATLYLPFAKYLKNIAEFPFKNIPVLKIIYSFIVDIMGYLSGETFGKEDKVVIVTLPESGKKVLGLLTQDDKSKLPKYFHDKSLVAVYIPMSFQLGGFTAFVPESHIERTDMKFDYALKGTISSWILNK